MALTLDQTLQAIQAGATSVTAIIALLALVAALRQIAAGQRSTRETAARDTFRELLKASLENTSCACGDANPENKLDNPKYVAFFFLILHALEGMATDCRVEEEASAWRSTIEYYL